MTSSKWLERVVVVNGATITLYSIDGRTWDSSQANLRQWHRKANRVMKEGSVPMGSKFVLPMKLTGGRGENWRYV